MDLNKLKVETEKGAELTLRHPVTDEPLDVVFTVSGMDSKRYKRASHAVQNRALSRGKLKITAEKLEANGVEILAACVIAWKNVEDSELFPDKAPKCTTENVTAFFDKHQWAKEQVDSFIADRANFLHSA